MSNFDIPDKMFDDPNFTTAPTSNRPGPIRYISNNPLVAQIINNNEIQIIGIGDVTITAIQDANRKYNQGIISTTFTVKDRDRDGDGIETVLITVLKPESRPRGHGLRWKR